MDVFKELDTRLARWRYINIIFLVAIRGTAAKEIIWPQTAFPL